MATTAKAGSRRANCPMPALSGEAVTRCSSFAGESNVREARDGCDPNTAMSIDWRASLVPAAAVIPAPEAYANIAAVKTLVVRLGFAGLLGVKPQWYVPAPTFTC